MNAGSLKAEGRDWFWIRDQPTEMILCIQEIEPLEPLSIQVGLTYSVDNASQLSLEFSRSAY